MKEKPVRDLDELFVALKRSRFRRRFYLGVSEQRYLQEKGMPTVLKHAGDFIAKRLAPAEPKNDGKQTPFRGHPVFVAQHATATCCRGCLAKWHRIEKGRELTQDERTYIVSVIAHWLRTVHHADGPPVDPDDGSSGAGKEEPA